jgi:tetratricopeptide (TPR) repeat protein
MPKTRVNGLPVRSAYNRNRTPKDLDAREAFLPQVRRPIVADPSQPSDPWSEPTTVRPAADPAADEGTVILPRETPAASFASGEFLANRFRIVRFLGHGGMGDVYEAEDEEVHGRVALKTVRTEIARLPGAVERFAREIHLARKVTHPNVCRIFDISHHGEVTFLTMELLPGETLEHRLRRTGAMQEEEALPLARQMAEGLAAAHRVGVVHRDFKPANVMLVPEDGAVRAVVMDFGLARGGETVGGGLTMRGDVLGTPSYMAPEQVAGEEITPATDVYAFGIVLYEMMTGALPFVGETALSTAVKRLREDPPAPRLKAPHLDPAWEAAILRCLARDPRQRFAGVRDAVAALAEAPPTVVLSLPAAPKPRRWLLPAAALVVLLGLAGGGWWWFSVRPRAEANRLLERANGLGNQGNFIAAAETFEQARKMLAGIGDLDAEAQALGDRGLTLGYGGQLSQGAAIVEQALDYFESRNDHKKQVKLLLDMGALYEGAPDLKLAEESFARAFALAPTAGDASLEARAAHNLGTVLYHRADLKDSYEKHHHALVIRTRLNDPDLVLSQLYVGEALYEMGRIGEAVPFARKAVEISRKSGNVASEAEAGALLARIRLKQSNSKEARFELNAIERIARKTQDPWIRGVVALAAGQVLAAEGRTGEAVRRLEAALKERTGLELDLRLGLAEIETQRGNRQRGLDLLRQVKTEAEGQGMRLIADKAARALSGP